MSMEMRSDGRFNYTPPDKIEIPQDSIVKAGDEMLPLCAMCSKSKLTCDNYYIREVELPMTIYDDLRDEVEGYRRQPDGSYIEGGLGFKLVDGVKAGIYVSEEDIPDPFVCHWFKPKTDWDTSKKPSIFQKLVALFIK